MPPRKKKKPIVLPSLAAFIEEDEQTNTTIQSANPLYTKCDKDFNFLKIMPVNVHMVSNLTKKRVPGIYYYNRVVGDEDLPKFKKNIIKAIGSGYHHMPMLMDHSLDAGKMIIKDHEDNQYYPDSLRINTFKTLEPGVLYLPTNIIFDPRGEFGPFMTIYDVMVGWLVMRSLKTESHDETYQLLDNLMEGGYIHKYSIFDGTMSWQSDHNKIIISLQMDKNYGSLIRKIEKYFIEDIS